VGGKMLNSSRLYRHKVKYIKEKLSDSCEIKVNTHSGQECLKLADSCEIKVNTHSEL